MKSQCVCARVCVICTSETTLHILTTGVSFIIISYNLKFCLGFLFCFMHDGWHSCCASVIIAPPYFTFFFFIHRVLTSVSISLSLLSGLTRTSPPCSRLEEALPPCFHLPSSSSSCLFLKCFSLTVCLLLSCSRFFNIKTITKKCLEYKIPP